jgi:glucan 1,3-beta-glucosidase
MITIMVMISDLACLFMLILPGIEPVNEPWELTPLHVLKDFYWSCYKKVKDIAPHWKFVMHDSFKFGTASWGGFMDGCPDIALDTHIYQVCAC